MKTSLILGTFILMLSFHSLQAQDFDIKNCGLDSSYTLNADEAAYFNEVLAEQKGEFDFTEKKIAFATGNSGRFVSNKFQYFAKDGRRRYESGQLMVNQLIILTAAEKTQLPEIDAIILSWSKVTLAGKNRQALVTLLSK